MKRRNFLSYLTAGFVTLASLPALAQEPVRIGLDAVLTGPGANNGERIREAAQWAVDLVNQKGGVALPDGSKRPLELVVVDDQAKPDVGLSAIRRLVGDKSIVAFMGPDWSSVTYPTLFVGAEAGIPQFTSSVAQRITQEGHKHIFRARSTDTDWMGAMADYLVKQEGKKKIGVTYANNEFGRSGRDVFVKILKETHGLDPAVELSYAVGDKDFTSVAGRLIQSGVDVVVNLGNQPEGALLIKDLNNLGYGGLFAFNSADSIFLDLAKSNAEGVVGPLSWVHTKPDEKSKAFNVEFQKRFNRDPIGHSVIYFDSVNMIVDAIGKVGPTREAILKYLKSVDTWQGVQGTYHPSAPTGDMIHASVVIRYNKDLVPEVVSVRE
ncbi:ABC transporter substrate-binding protein [Microvirga antarctica]|uniref:ABC transporter substrate-binding protein n=1 Tax=Microvirga antarctica TaxID=2819233 RepID=UPI001B30E881|nr:ABC transporter substrate-binding protein [Microvirga antarctica]